jgi:hypothetical protein
MNFSSVANTGNKSWKYVMKFEVIWGGIFGGGGLLYRQ